MINEVATTHRPLVLRARVAHEKRKEKRQRDLKEPSTAQRQTCLTKFFPPKLRRIALNGRRCDCWWNGRGTHDRGC